MQIRYHIDPTTGQPHIYEHQISEQEVEDILGRPLQDIRGRDSSRISIGQTQEGRHLKVIYVPDPFPIPFSSYRRMSWVTKRSGQSAVDEGESHEERTYPRGWNEARVRRVLDYYESQSDEEAAAEIESGLQSTTMQVPVGLVPAVRRLIAERRLSQADRAETHRAGLRSSASRTERAAGAKSVPRLRRRKP